MPNNPHPKEALVALLDELDKLHEVQKIDAQIYQREQTMAAQDSGEGLKQQAIVLLKRHDAAVKALHKVETEQKDRELELKGIEEKRAKVHTKLYGGHVNNPKELGDLQKDEEMLDHQISALEEIVLVQMEQVESARKIVAQLAGELDAAKRRWKTTVAHTQAETKRLQGEIAALRPERERLAADIEKHILRRYDGIRQRAYGIGMVVTGNDTCPACHVRLDAHVINRLREGEELVLCENCGRILLWRL